MRTNTFPGSSIRLDLECSASGGVVNVHPVTITAEGDGTESWSVETGHDWEMEQIAIGLGGQPPACWDLVRTQVPALHRYYMSLHHDPVVEISLSSDGTWGLSDPVEGCECVTRRWHHPEYAVTHYRGLTHWCMAQKANRHATQQLLRQLAEVTGPEPWTDNWTKSTSTDAVYSHEDLFDLWTRGIHPDIVHDIHRGLGLSEPLDAKTYEAIIRNRIDERWLRRFGASAPAVDWVARTYSRQDAAHPERRLDLYLAGVNFRLIDSLLASPFSPDDVRTLAAATATSMNEAAYVLSEWHTAKCTPALDDVIRMCRMVPHARQAPTAKAIDLVVKRTGAEASGLNRTQIGLLLVAAGTPTTAAALINRGVKTLDDFEDWQAMEGRH